MYQRFLASRPRGAENLAIAEVIERTRWTGARTHILHLSSSDALPMLRTRQGRRSGPHRRDLPALPDPDGRGDPQRRHRVQVLPADPRDRQPRAALAGPAGRHDRLHRLRPLPLHPGPEGPRERRLRGGLGRHRLGAARPVAGLDRGPAPRTRAWSRWSTGWPPARPIGCGCAPRVGSRSATTPTSRSSRPTTRTWSTPASSGTATPSPRTRARSCPDVVRRTFVRGTEVDYDTPHGRLIRRGID